MNHERRRRDLCNAAICLPSENGLQLRKVGIRGGIPLSTHLGILRDALRRSSSGIDERTAGFRELVGILASRLHHLHGRFLSSTTLAPTRPLTPPEQRSHFLPVLE